MTKLEQVLSETAVIVPVDEGEAMKVNSIDLDEKIVHASGEETGEEYYIPFDEIELDKNLFYKLALIEV